MGAKAVKPGMLLNTSNSSTQEAQDRELQVGDQPGPQNETLRRAQESES